MAPIPPERTCLMPLLEIVKTRHVTASIRLEEPTAALIDQYAAFLRASADEVVDKALTYVFAKDRDFQEFLRTPKPLRFPRVCAFGVSHNRTPLPSLRAVLRSPQGQWRRPVIRVLVANNIPFGASHRVNFDTPPLKGNCPDTLVSRQIPLKTHEVRKTRYLPGYRRLRALKIPND